ncbi:MAG TPA: hypothetical protein PKV46_10470, partial [Candidatus Marinimicrobia bacterium]|nr:hypothetical protein [Candidatus Neomarinimicrobiota bacterium]HQQ86322.1 hypothetical protein [Candidatus Neomarinimicrobiota bacterium]
RKVTIIINKTLRSLRPSRLKKNLTRQVRQEPPMTKISNYSISIISYDSEQYLIKLFNVNEEY